MKGNHAILQCCRVPAFRALASLPFILAIVFLIWFGKFSSSSKYLMKHFRSKFLSGRLIIGERIPISDWGVPLPEGGMPSPKLVASACSLNVTAEVHCTGDQKRVFWTVWNNYIENQKVTKAFAISKDCSHMSTETSSKSIGSAICDTAQGAVRKCGAQCEVLHAQPAGYLVIGARIPISDWGVPLPEGGVPSPTLVASACRFNVPAEIHCIGDKERFFRKVWQQYIGLKNVMKAFAISKDCSSMYIRATPTPMGDGICHIARGALEKCGTQCGVLHAEPVGCLRAFDAELQASLLNTSSSSSSCSVDVFTGPKATGHVERFRSGNWSLAQTVGSLQVHGASWCAARLFEFKNFTGWFGTFHPGIFLAQDVAAIAPGGGMAIQVGLASQDFSARCFGSSVPHVKRYVMLSDPCGLTHGGQGLGGLLSTFQIGLQIAHRLEAKFIHNPGVLCADRDNVAYISERLFQFDYCDNVVSRQRIERGELPIVRLEIANRGFGIHGNWGDLNRWHSLMRTPFLQNIPYFKESLKKANLSSLPAEAFFEIQGCPWVRSWGSVSEKSRRVAGQELRAALKRGFISQGRSSQWRHHAVRIAIHFRYGDVGKTCEGHWGPGDPFGCNANLELREKYHSDATAVITTLQKVLSIINKMTDTTLSDIHLALFSEGNPTDPPFVQLNKSFPFIKFHLKSNHPGIDIDPTLSRDIFQMASADIMIASCGTFSTAIGILNDCGILLAPPCSIGEMAEAPCQIPIEYSTTLFHENVFQHMWLNVFRDRVLPRATPSTSSAAEAMQ